jgi:hypothetical protein
MITDALVQIIFGWPAIIASILLSIAGVALKRPAFLVAAGIIGIPFAAYLTAGSRVPGLLLPLCQLGSAYAVKREMTRIAWLLSAPMMIMATVLAYFVLTQ